MSSVFASALRASVAGLTAAILLSATAQAATTTIKVYSDLGAKNSFDSHAEPVFGPAEASGLGHYLQWVAGRFTASASGPLDYLDVALASYSGQNGAIISLVKDNGGKPDTNTNDAQLETFLNEKLKPYTGLQKVVKLVSKLHPQLTAGSTYWIVVQPIGLNNVTAWDFTNVTTTTDPSLFSTNGGVTWASDGNPAVAFDVWVYPPPQ